MTGGEMERKREREKPVRDRWIHSLWPSSLIGILLFATDASFHNKSPTPCLHCQWIFKLHGPTCTICSACLSCFSPTACISKSIPNANGRESCMCRQKAGEALICGEWKCQFSLTVCSLFSQRQRPFWNERKSY